MNGNEPKALYISAYFLLLMRSYINDYYFHKLYSPTYQTAKPALYIPFNDAYSAPSDTPGSSLDSVLDAKLMRAKTRIDAVVSAIEARSEMKESNLGKLEEDLCACQTLLFDLGYKIYARNHEWLDLEKKKIDLAKEKRMESVSYFRDVTLLGKELRDTRQYYQSILDKMALMGGIGETFEVMEENHV